MAVGWLAILKMVPWTEVIGKAPVLADGAKKLWRNVARKPPAPKLADDHANAGLSPQAHAIATLEARLAAVEAAASALHDQMLASSELIKALADQNTELIRCVEVNRRRIVWLAGLSVVLGIVLVVHLSF